MTDSIHGRNDKAFWQKVAGTWVVERHPKGRIAASRLLDVLERNYQRWKEGKKDAGWEILGILPTYESALERARELKYQKQNKEEE